MTIKAIVSDLGNVIVKVHWSRFCSKMAKQCDYSQKDIHNTIVRSKLKDKYELGLLTSKEFYKQVVSKLKSDLDYKRFALFWSDIFTPNKPVIEILKKLKTRYPLFLLSNTGELHFNYIKPRCPILSLFNGFVLSYKVSLAKPDRRIYQKAIELTGCKPEECVYIDDIKEYSDVASRVGMRGINYKTTAQLKKELKNLGVVWQ